MSAGDDVRDGQGITAHGVRLWASGFDRTWNPATALRHAADQLEAAERALAVVRDDLGRRLREAERERDAARALLKRGDHLVIAHHAVGAMVASEWGGVCPVCAKEKGQEWFYDVRDHFHPAPAAPAGKTALDALLSAACTYAFNVGFLDGHTLTLSPKNATQREFCAALVKASEASPQTGDALTIDEDVTPTEANT